MAVQARYAAGSRSRWASTETAESRLIFLVSFPVFLAAALLSRLLPPSVRPGFAAGGRSVVAEARAAANTCIPFAFMG